VALGDIDSIAGTIALKTANLSQYENIVVNLSFGKKEVLVLLLKLCMYHLTKGNSDLCNPSTLIYRKRLLTLREYSTMNLSIQLPGKD
jgi:hypothetical protein